MAFVHYTVAQPLLSKAPNSNINHSSIERVVSSSLLSSSSSSFCTKSRNSSHLSRTITTFGRFDYKASAKQPESEAISAAADAFTQFKHMLLPITDKNPYLSEGTRQAAATVASLAKKYEADITVVVIDENSKELAPEQHDTKLSSIRWHLSEGGFQEFRLIERLGEGKKPTAIIGEVADDLNLDLVVISMEAIHSKHVDANLLAEFIPCPVLLLPL